MPRLPWAIPIKDLFAREAEESRALVRRIQEEREAAAQEQRTKARDESIRQLSQEADMLKAGRANVLSSLISMTQMLPALKRLSEDIAKNVAQGQVTTTRDGMRILREYGTIVRQLTFASQSLIEAERQRRGEPTEVLGIRVDGHVTVEEAAEEIDELSSLLALARARGLVEVPAKAGTPAELPPTNGKGGHNGTNGTTH